MSETNDPKIAHHVTAAQVQAGRQVPTIVRTIRNPNAQTEKRVRAPVPMSKTLPPRVVAINPPNHVQLPEPPPGFLAAWGSLAASGRGWERPAAEGSEGPSTADLEPPASGEGEGEA